MGLITKFKSARYGKKDKDTPNNETTMRRPSPTQSQTTTTNISSNTSLASRTTRSISPSKIFSRKLKDNYNARKLNTCLSTLTVVSIPKEYKEEERFNWLTNEIDTFEYKDPSDTVKARKKSPKPPPDAGVKDAEVAENDCFGPDWLFPCWGSRIKDVKEDVRTTDETSYSSGSTEDPPDNKEGQVLEATGVDDVSDITSAPSEDCSDCSSSEDEEGSACLTGFTEGETSQRSRSRSGLTGRDISGFSRVSIGGVGRDISGISKPSVIGLESMDALSVSSEE